MARPPFKHFDIHMKHPLIALTYKIPSHAGSIETVGFFHENILFLNSDLSPKVHTYILQLVANHTDARTQYINLPPEMFAHINDGLPVDKAVADYVSHSILGA